MSKKTTEVRMSEASVSQNDIKPSDKFVFSDQNLATFNNRSEMDDKIPVFTLEEETQLLKDLVIAKSTIGVDDTDYLRRSVQLPKN